MALCSIDAKKRSATHSKGSSATASHGTTFEAVPGPRKRKIPGFRKHGQKFYAQLRVAMGDDRAAPYRNPLDTDSLSDAKAELENTRTKRHDGKLPQTGFRPKFEDFAAE